jgi:hypothetical protein
MLHHIKKLFGIKKKEEPAVEVPYKIDTPVPAVKPEKAPKTTTAKKPRKPKADIAVQAMVESIPAPTPAKKPRAPRKPKTPKVG